MITLAKPTPLTTPTWAWICQHPAHFIAFGFGSGLARKAPGTIGTLAAIPLYVCLSLLLSPQLILFLCIPSFLIGIWACHVTGKALGISDYGGLVWDEIVAMWLVLALSLWYAPPLSNWMLILHYLVAFGLFRLFDIAKPWPISWLDRTIKGGLGVMLDDIIAAAFALASLWGLHALVWPV